MSSKAGKVLTAKIAEKAIAQEKCKLNKYTEIEDAAAEALAKYEGPIELNRLHQLPESAAKHLASHRGELWLCGLIELSESTALLISKHEGGLFLNGLKTLTLNSARQLIQTTGILSLDGLKDLSDELAKVLVKHSGPLSLRGLSRMSDETATILSKHEGSRNWLPQLPVSYKDHGRNGGLFLDGLKTLTLESARALAKHQEFISLGGLKSVTQEIFDIFCQREGGAWIWAAGVWAPCLYDIEKVADEKGNDEQEFIVALDFQYCDVNYEGFRIMERGWIRSLLAALETNSKIGTPNMPGSWYEEFDIGLLKYCFKIHSPWPSEINAMRNLFGDCVGETSLFSKVLDHVPSSDKNDQEGP
jgi:hypothetical protein